MYYINLQLTEKGTKVCGSPTKTLEMSWNEYFKPTDDDVNAFIESEFIPELVEQVISVKSDFRFLKKDDYVCVVTPGKEDTREIGQVLNIQDNGYGHSISVIVKDLKCNNSKEFRFTFEGLEIGGPRKNKRFIEIPSHKEIEHYENIKNICQTYVKVLELLHYTYEWEDDYEDDYVIQRMDPPLFLEPEELIQIFNILKNAKNRFDILNN